MQGKVKTVLHVDSGFDEEDWLSLLSIYSKGIILHILHMWK